MVNGRGCEAVGRWCNYGGYDCVPVLYRSGDSTGITSIVVPDRQIQTITRGTVIPEVIIGIDAEWQAGEIENVILFRGN